MVNNIWTRSTGKPLLLLLTLLLVSTWSVSVQADDTAGVINLRDVPAPYSFGGICKLPSGELWEAGGDGHLRYASPGGKTREYRPVKDEDLSGIYFVNSDKGWVVGENGTILYTSNGGRKWTRQVSRVKTDLKAVTCTDEKHCWIVGRNSVLATKDGGVNWNEVKLATEESLVAVDFINNRTGWAVGTNGMVARTRDGGATWEIQQVRMFLFPDTVTNLKAVKFENEQLGWVAGMAGIARTLDGGETWEITGIDETFIGLVSAGSTRVWAVTNSNPQGLNYCSEDAGQTWHKCYSQLSNSKR